MRMKNGIAGSFYFHMSVLQDVRLLTVIWCAFLQSQVLCSQSLKCDSNDFRALQDFLNGLESVGSKWGANTSINCCDWSGVVCNSSSSLGLEAPSDSARVVGLLLGSKRLEGNISDSLGQLDQLRVLNLSRNLHKGTLPSSILHLTNLKVLDLSYNYFNGEFPESIDLPSIQLLDISLNSFTGFLPVAICANSSQLRVLNLSSNHFTGTIPSGFWNCSSMEELGMGGNDLTGNIHADIFQLQHLVRLDLSANRFSGGIPDLFQNLERLQYFAGQSNQFTGSIPPSISNSSSLVFLDLRNNSLCGRIALNCSAMNSLEVLNLASNNFIGPLPSTLPECQRLQKINLARNNFDGQIPDSYKNFQRLAYLSLSNCSLSNVSSSLGILQRCNSLTHLILTMNFRDEELPSEAGLSFSNLLVLVIAGGRLRGSFPKWLRNSTNLGVLDLSWNRLIGSVPPWLGDFPYLFYLDLSNNSLSSEIPRTITNLSSLRNRVSSVMDQCPEFPLFLKRNISIMGYQYNHVSRLPPTLDFSYNSLNGMIWPEFGKLKSLIVLKLRNNSLSGPIPDELSGVISLESLDLSHNHLSGTLPSSLVSLSFLSTFSVAFNNLYGPIPEGTQFATFPDSSFEGTRLCSNHAHPLCPSDSSDASPADTSLLPEEPSSSDTVDGMLAGFGMGYIFAVIFCFLITAAKWRIALPRRGTHLRITFFTVRFLGR